MDDGLAGVVLAAGAGSRLAPLSRYRPKALVPVATIPLVEGALARLAPYVGSCAVNLHHGADQLDARLDGRIHRSLERPVPLGTAGALGRLRGWLDGRAALVTNADAWHGPDLDLDDFVTGWDRQRVRLLCVSDPARGDFGPLRYCGIALMPSSKLAVLEPEPSGLYEVCWRQERALGRLDLVVSEAQFVDCGTPADYLAANLAASGGASVVDPSARVDPGAVLVRSVVWDGAHVHAGERLVDAVRTPELTVLVR